MDQRQDRAIGAIMGTLIGDALGVGPHWYYDLDQLRMDYGDWIDNYTEPKPGRFHEGVNAGENSQTGQVVTLLLESIYEHEGYNGSDFTERLDSLLDKLDGTPKGGRYTDKAMRDVWEARKKRSLDWSEAGSFADTAEAAIRTPVLAACYYNELNTFLDALQSNILLTHRDPFIAGQSAAFGLIIASLIGGEGLGNASKTIIRKLSEERTSAVLTVIEDNRKLSISFMDAILQSSWAYEAAHDSRIKIEPASAVCRLFGLACTLGFMLPAAYYLASRFEADFYNPLMSALNGGGNNMARASLTGALAGAQVGLSGIPDYLIEGLFDHERLIRMAEKITSQK